MQKQIKIAKLSTLGTLYNPSDQFLPGNLFMQLNRDIALYKDTYDGVITAKNENEEIKIKGKLKLLVMSTRQLNNTVITDQKRNFDVCFNDADTCRDFENWFSRNWTRLGEDEFGE